MLCHVLLWYAMLCCVMYFPFTPYGCLRANSICQKCEMFTVGPVKSLQVHLHDVYIRIKLQVCSFNTEKPLGILLSQNVGKYLLSSLM